MVIVKLVEEIDNPSDQFSVQTHCCWLKQKSIKSNMTEVFLDIKKDSYGGIILQKSCLIVLNSLSRLSFVTLLLSEAIYLSVHFVAGFCPVAQLVCYDFFQKFTEVGPIVSF